ncbi:MAG: glycerol-3-phosphate acyltransferase [Chloroflexi bacterium]|nr:glycerol-3-phosphate acyltransferase [Chloroflexota bacterium]
MNPPAWLILVGAYLIGSFPTAYLVGRRYGVDLRRTGDGNLGARNAYLTLGRIPGVTIGVVDIFKGMLAVWLAKVLSSETLLPYLAAVAVALGHDFSIFARFQGGQGMAAILGGMVILQPREALLGIGAALLVLLLTRHWDLAWLIGLGGMFALGLYFERPVIQAMLVACLFLTIGVKKVADAPLRQHIRGGRP